uniref:PLA2c domain-containing protein n=1 Tax=Echeneis naucrates TaxID=173247 RepID=A0A665U025_ECHNA
MTLSFSQKPIRQSHTLCAGEQEYVERRKKVVMESLNSLGINCTADSVPHIALLGSGGGQRAAVGLVGSLYQMKKDGLLDTLLYLGGVSGSTWSMSSLYSDPQWSTNMNTAVSKLSGPGVELEQALGWLIERAKEEHFSLTDVWGALTSAAFMKQMDLRHLSDDAGQNATNPYPIYSAIENSFSDGPIEGKWFEMSPHESGFPEMGLFIETSLLGSKFQDGRLLEKKPEMDMVKLQGIFGSALADVDIIREFIPSWLVSGQVDRGAEEYLRVYGTTQRLLVLTSNTVNDPAAVSDLNGLQKILKDKVNHNESVLPESRSLEESEDIFQQRIAEILESVQACCLNLEDGDLKTFVSLLTEQVLPLILKWEWGTTNNFLYQYQDFPIPSCLHRKESFQLIDAGLFINVSYPSFLGDKRDIDLIIAPEFSAGNMFETLTQARDYAAEVNKPFPKIDDKVLEERDWPKDCYVFEGKDKEPTIVYLPLFNRKNCKDAEEFSEKMEEFSTFQPPYSEEKMLSLLEMVKSNIKNNKETLLREINKAVLRRQNKRKPEPYFLPYPCCLL